MLANSFETLRGLRQDGDTIDSLNYVLPDVHIENRVHFDQLICETTNQSVQNAIQMRQSRACGRHTNSKLIYKIGAKQR